MKQTKPRAGLVLLDAIRVETALSRYPIHRLARQGTVHIELKEVDEAGEMTLRWEISHNSKYGQPGPLAYKVDTLVVNRKLEGAGWPIPRVVRLGSLREIAEATGSGDGNTTAIKRALYQNASAFITAKIRYRADDGAERRAEIGDTRYAVVFTGEELPDGRTADAVFVVLHDFYREILNHALTRPLDYDYLRDLPPASQRWYELASYRMFAAIKNGKPRATLVYSEFCLYAPQARYADFDRVKKQMWKVHNPHRKAGYIADVEFEAATDRDGRPDWLMHYTPGPKAEAEHRAFTGAGGAGPAKDPPDPGTADLERELVERGVTRAVAAELVGAFEEGRIRSKMEQVDWLRAKDPRKIADVAAYIVGAVRGDYAAPAGYQDKAERRRRDEDERRRRGSEAEARRAKARAQDDEARVAAYWKGLTEEEQRRLEDRAIAQADAETRAALERGPAVMRKTFRRLAREAFIRDLLGLAAPETTP